MDLSFCPMLVVKPGTVFQPLKKIAFATEFRCAEQDLNIVYRLVAFAKLLNIEILLVHIANPGENPETLHKTLERYLLDLSNKADYPNIYYRLVQNRDMEGGLTWLCDHGQVDMLAMAHRPQNALADYFESSRTKRMNTLLALPLLIFPLIEN